MIISNFTSFPNNSSVVEYVFAFNKSMDGLAVFALLIAILVVLAMGLYYWSDDFVFSIKNALYFVSFTAFIGTLIRSGVFMNSAGTGYMRLVNFYELTFFVVLLALVVFYDEVSD